MDSKRKQHPIEPEVEGAASTPKAQRVLTLRELIPPKQFRKNLRAFRVVDRITSPHVPSIVNDEDPSTRETQLDWTAVIARVKSHPAEAKESYFVQSSSACMHDGSRPAEIADAAPPNNNENTILTYKPLHAMLKYDPPVAAVEAVLRAHPYAALDMTFEGTALKIAAESKVSTTSILRLLLVAEMAMRKKVMIDNRLEQEREEKRQSETAAVKSDESSYPSSDTDISVVVADTSVAVANTLANNFDLISVIPTPQSPDRMFIGHNPIRWIAESHIPRKTAALLLKWYPVGAFQRPRDDDGLPVEEIEQDYHDEDAMYSDSPFIEIVDDFASDQDAVEHEDNEAQEESESEDEDVTGHSILPRRKRTFAEREYLRKERRWEKFLHILYATDKILMSMKAASNGSSSTDQSTLGMALSSNSQSVVTVTADASTDAPSSDSNATIRPPQVARFHPVHAFIRCITNPSLGFEICRPYGVWSILRAMGQRIPSEFTAKDESDGDRTVFQTLAESKAVDCRLCIEEVRDVVECLMDADYRSAHLPRKSDGRLIVHVARENGWPCREMFSRKTSATCA